MAGSSPAITRSLRRRLRVERGLAASERRDLAGTHHLVAGRLIVREHFQPLGLVVADRSERLVGIEAPQRIAADALAQQFEGGPALQEQRHLPKRAADILRIERPGRLDGEPGTPVEAIFAANETPLDRVDLL